MPGEEKPKLCSRRYPWVRWFARKKLKLFRAKDYNGIDSNFVILLRRRAAECGVKVTVHVGVGWVEVTVLSRHPKWKEKLSRRGKK